MIHRKKQHDDRKRLCIARKPGESVFVGRMKLIYLGIFGHRPRFVMMPNGRQINASWDLETEVDGFSIRCNPASGQRVQVVFSAPESLRIMRSEKVED